MSSTSTHSDSPKTWWMHMCSDLGRQPTREEWRVAVEKRMRSAFRELFIDIATSDAYIPGWVAASAELDKLECATNAAKQVIKELGYDR